MLQAKQNINYIRNSVKATVDAYDGTVTLYAFDDTDPILQGVEQGVRRQPDQAEVGASRPSWPRTSATRRTCSRSSATCWRSSTSTDPRQFNSGQDFWQVPDDPAADRTRTAGQAAAVLPADPVPRAETLRGSS